MRARARAHTHTHTQSVEVFVLLLVGELGGSETFMGALQVLMIVSEGI